MVVSFFTNCSNPGLSASIPRSKLLLPHSLYLQPSTRSKSSIRLRFSANRHITHSSPPSSSTTAVENQLQAQSEENDASSTTEVSPESELKQMQGGSEDKERQRSGLGKVAGTAGVVLAVVVASLAALVSVNAILAELSDKVFDGKISLQDFF